MSLESSTLCIVDQGGKILRETVVVSEPEALIGWFSSCGYELSPIGLEAGLYLNGYTQGSCGPVSQGGRLRPRR